MSLTLYFHPLSSFCHKVLIPLYENGTPFEGRLVDLSDADAAAAFKRVWPVGKFPVLRDDANGRTIPESSVIIEYLDQHYPGRTRFIPADADLALQTRLTDRFYDLHLHGHMQKVIGDRLRPPGKNDPHGVEQARAQMQTALDMIDKDMAGKTWAVGDDFSMADCAAAPTLFYTSMVIPFSDTHKNVAAYFRRLTERPCYARALKEAEPYFSMIPKPKAAAER